MRGTMLIFRPSQQHAERKHFDRALTLEDLKDGIGGGYFELVPGFRAIAYAGVVMDFCDEDGKRKQLHINELANDAWDQAFVVDVPKLLPRASK